MRHVTFYRLHVLSFLLVDLIGTLVIYLSPPGPLGPITFIDALFNATSALCVTGLITVQVNEKLLESEAFAGETYYSASTLALKSHSHHSWMLQH